MSSRTPFADLPLPQQAGIICTDPRFQRYCGELLIGKGQDLSESACAQYIRDTCAIGSRSDLADDPQAARQFHQLVTDYKAATGQIAKPR